MSDERLSREEWMNDIAADDVRMPRGWHAVYQPRCDVCGKFMRHGAPGSSWVSVPDCPPVSFGDERERCPSCTERHGPATASPQYVQHLVCGVVPAAGEGRG